MMRWVDTWDKPRVGDSGGKAQVGIVRTHGFSSWLIRLITRAPVNHMVLDTGAELVSAEFPFVRTRPYGHFTNIVWSQFPFEDGQADKIVDFAYQQIGKPYGTLDDIAIGIALITRQHTPKCLERWLSNNGEWICSSLCDAALQAAGIHIWDDNRPVGAVPPSAFWKFYRDVRWLPKRILFSKRV